MVCVVARAEGGCAITVDGVDAELIKCSHVVSATCAWRRMLPERSATLSGGASDS